METAMTDVGALQARVEAIESREQIAEVLHRYCRGWDRRDEEVIRGCFWPEARHQHGIYDGLSVDFVAFGLSRTTHVKGVRHTVSNIIIELAGDRAISECYFAAIHRRPTADGTSEEDYFLEGRFVDRLERRGGEWRIIHRVGLNEFERVQPRSDVTLDALPVEARGRWKPQDRLYAMLADFREGR
jgi:hypothetical protein